MAQQGGGTYSVASEDMDEGTNLKKVPTPMAPSGSRCRGHSGPEEFEELPQAVPVGPWAIWELDIQITQKQTLFSVTTSYLANPDLPPPCKL